jgi:hypothetical protein
VLANYTITYNTATFSITPRPASVTPDAASKVYGDADAALTGLLSGFVAADGVTATYARTSGETVAGSPYTISATLSPAGVLGNYTITYNTGAFTITPKPASVTPDPASKVYGDADPAFTGTLSGFLAADAVMATYSRTGGETVLGSPYTISATLSPASVLSNYSITYNTATFTITTKPASVTPNLATKVYGSADPAFTGTLSGFLAADGVTATYSRTAGEPVLGSPYTISATLNPASVLSNYSITYNTATFTITTKPASVTPNPATKVYGSVDPAFTGTLSGFLVGDGVTAAYSRTAGETVAGSPYTISATLSPAGVLSNYTITYNTAAFTITTKPASVTPNAATKVYGSADPALTGALSGFLAGDSVTATYSRTPGQTVAGSPYTISATLSPAGVLANYTITYNTANFTITQATLTIAATARTKVFNATYTPDTTPPSVDFTVTGTLYFGDTITSITLNSTGYPSSALPGSYAVTPSAAVFAPVDAATNYNITYTPGTLSIGYGTCTNGTPSHQILPPINVDGSSVWKVGSTVPVKFTVCDANGNPISDPNAVFATGMGSITLINTVRGTVDNVNEATYTDIPDVAFRWSGGQWIFNMATSNLTKNTTYTFRINLKDGSYIQFSAGTK